MAFETIEVDGEESETRLAELRRRFKSDGKYPFFIGDHWELSHLEEWANLCQKDMGQTVADSRSINALDWFAQRRADRGDAADEAFYMGEWPSSQVPNSRLTVNRDLVTGKLMPMVMIGLARIDEPWMVPAYLKYGGWNECPPPEVHCAIMKHWQSGYGAEIVSMSHDVIECEVSRPPSSRENALNLAREQFRYCEDIVLQGCESIANLASVLLNSKYWYFWWD
jgi:hypothetical protein